MTLYFFKITYNFEIIKQEDTFQIYLSNLFIANFFLKDLKFLKPGLISQIFTLRFLFSEICCILALYQAMIKVINRTSQLLSVLLTEGVEMLP